MNDAKDEAPFDSNTQLEPVDEAQRTMSLLGGVATPEDLPEADLELDSIKPPSKLLNRSTLLIVCVYVVAALTLYAMRVGHGEMTSNTDAQQVENKIREALAKLSNPNATTASGDPLPGTNLKDLFVDTDEIVKMFASDLTSRQVPTDGLKKNPFALPIFKSLVSDEPKDDEEAKAKLEAELKRMKALEKELEQLELQSVMHGARPVAIISGEFYQPGDTIGSFTVVSIDNLSIELENEGQTFTIEMEDPSKQQRRR